MDPFVDQLAALCRAHPTRSKWVVVPSHAAGRTLGDRLVLGGTDWANLRFVTPVDLAVRMGAPFLVERGIDPSEEGLGPALIMRLLFGLDDGPVEYFRPLAHQPSLGQALWTTIRELRLAGVSADDLARTAAAPGMRATELEALLRAYEAFLEKNLRGDVATVFAEALQHPHWCPVQPGDCWTELPDVVWAPLPRRLMDRLPGERIVPETLALPGGRSTTARARARRSRRAAGIRAARVPAGARGAAGQSAGRGSVRPSGRSEDSLNGEGRDRAPETPGASRSRPALAARCAARDGRRC